jgi:hypothetical protein
MKLRVECYAGAKADERPVRFVLGERAYMVEEMIDQWYGPDDTFFKVRADDGNWYILRNSHSTRAWTLESFRGGQAVAATSLALPFCFTFRRVYFFARSDAALRASADIPRFASPPVGLDLVDPVCHSG